MAEFCKEFIDRNNWNLIPDFSIHLEFKKLKEGEVKNLICEGFDFNAMKKENNTCILLYNSGVIKPFDELINQSFL